MHTIKIFSAGVAGGLTKQAAEEFQRSHPDVNCQVELGGSTGGIRKLLAGAEYDVMVLADCSNIEEMMMPEYADGYCVWAGNSIVAMGEGINDGNWKEKLTAPDSRILHMNPYDDPGGYRAVMAMKLADAVEPGLSGRLLHHPNYHGLDRAQYETRPALDQMEPGTYFLGYKTLAVGRGLPYANLPDEMNLSNPAYESLYRSVSFSVDGGAVVAGTAILHGIVIPKQTRNQALAVEFAKAFLAARFSAYGFTPVQKKVGTWTIAPDNMWDREAKYYSLMTLMEIKGTNQQLDCIPLEPEDVVLDCGCGPGRIAIQAAKRVKKVICLDSSEEMLAACRQNCRDAGVTNVEFILADWQEAEAGKTFPEVDVVIQSRGGGGPTSLAKLKQAARKYAVSILWAEGAPNLPESRQKLFEGCYSPEALEAYPELKPFRRPQGAPPNPAANGALFGGRGAIDMADKLPMGGRALWDALERAGVEYTVKTIDEGWDRQFSTRQEAYDALLPLSRHPELVDMEQFRKNVDSFLTENEQGFYFFLPTSTDVTVYKVR